MLDGFKCSCIGQNPEAWLNNPILDFGLSVSANTGELLTERMKAKADSLTFSVGDGCACSIAGSLHKYHNAPGCYNWDRFYFPDVIDTLDKLEKQHGVNLETAELHGLEIGVNVLLNYAPKRVFRSAICHNGKAFDSIDRGRENLGIICDHTDYTIKLYDKGKQSRIGNTNDYILRVELKIKRKRMLEPYGVSTLADLKSLEKVAAFLELLAKKVAGIVFFDFSLDTSGLSDSKKLAWERFGNPKYWQEMDKNKAYKARKKMKQLTEKYGAIDGGRLLLEKICKEWFLLAGLESGKNGITVMPGYDVFWTCKQEKKATFSKLEYVVEMVATGDQKEGVKNMPHQANRKGVKNSVLHPEKNRSQKRRFCATCGREITHLRADARFCSEKERGREAKRCRNKDSNRRLTMKRKIIKTMKEEKLLRIIYIDKHGNEYSDILGRSEIKPTREWLDRILSIEILDDNKHMKGKEARDYVEKSSDPNINNVKN